MSHTNKSKELSVVYPISANPPTWGHADIMMRAAQKFDHVYWVAAENPSKQSLFSYQDRIKMMRVYVDYYKLENVTIDYHSGTIVRYASGKGAQFLLRGLRNTTDFQMELELSAGNRGINKEIETVCLYSKPHFATISSSLVRELAILGEKISQYVAPSVEKIVLENLKKIS